MNMVCMASTLKKYAMFGACYQRLSKYSYPSPSPYWLKKYVLMSFRTTSCYDLQDFSATHWPVSSLIHIYTYFSPKQSWNAFPKHCLTKYESPFLGDSFHLSIESRYVADDNGTEKNALNLDETELNQRQVVNVNIASDYFMKMSDDANVREFRSTKVTLPILDADGVWIREGNPVMCCYKVCRLHVSGIGLPSSRMEEWGHRHGLLTAFLRFHRQQLCWIDSWTGLRIGDVDGFNDSHQQAQKLQGAFHSSIKAAASVLATEVSSESIAGLAFAKSDETNPFVTWIILCLLKKIYKDEISSSFLLTVFGTCFFSRHESDACEPIVLIFYFGRHAIGFWSVIK